MQNRNRPLRLKGKVRFADAYQVGINMSHENRKFQGFRKCKIKKYTVKLFFFSKYVVIGESKNEIKEKLYKSLDCKFNTFLCIGENKKTARPFFSIKKEINFYLKNIDKSKLKNLSIIYEPNYSIGSAYINDIDYITMNIRKIKCYVKNKFNINIEVFYGGLINKENIKQIINICDGIIIGKRSSDILVMKELLCEL